MFFSRKQIDEKKRQTTRKCRDKNDNTEQVEKELTYELVVFDSKGNQTDVFTQMKAETFNFHNLDKLKLGFLFFEYDKKIQITGGRGLHSFRKLSRSKHTLSSVRGA